LRVLQHYVFIKYVTGTTDAHVEEFCRRMLTLQACIPEIEQLEVGRDILRDARSWDLMLIMGFASVEALRHYQLHPEHQKVMKFNQSALADVGSVDILLPG
jgi:hypothetical protein